MGTALGLSPTKVRQAVADQITDKNWADILQTYQIQQKFDQFEEDWDPSSVYNVDVFRQIVKTPKIVWGDHNLICLAQKAFDVNILPLQRQRGKPSNIYNVLDYDPTRDKNVFLDYLSDKQHFRLTGYASSLEDTTFCFNNSQIPIQMKEIVYQDIGIKI